MYIIGLAIHVCHKGYISLFPMILGLLPADSPKLSATLDIIENEDELWSPYGLRSLSLSDPMYNTGEVYWRGPIWLNINYLTLQSLYNVSIYIYIYIFVFILVLILVILFILLSILELYV